MKYSILVSASLAALVLTSCKFPESDSAPKGCTGDAKNDSLDGHWNVNFNGKESGNPHFLKMHFGDDGEATVRFSCQDAYSGKKSKSVRVKVPFIESEDEAFLNIGFTDVMNPSGNYVPCDSLNFGGDFTYNFVGKCLKLEDSGGAMFFERGI